MEDKVEKAIRKVFFAYIQELRMFLDAEILTKETFDHASHTFTYYLN